MSQCRFRPQIPIDFQPFISILESPERILSLLYTPPHSGCFYGEPHGSSPALFCRIQRLPSGRSRCAPYSRCIYFSISDFTGRCKTRPPGPMKVKAASLAGSCRSFTPPKTKGPPPFFCMEAVLFTSLPQPAVCLRPPVFRAAQRQVLPAERALSSGKNGCPWH